MYVLLFSCGVEGELTRAYANDVERLHRSVADETSGGAVPELQDACPGSAAGYEEVGELEERNRLRRLVYQV